MAEAALVCQAVMRQEDANLSGVVTKRPDDLGGLTRFGIAAKWHPDLQNTTFYTDMPREAALQVATGIYEKEYAAPLQIDQIASLPIAVKLMSFAVNASMRTAVCKMQMALNLVYPTAMACAVDGVMGPKTLDEINRCLEQSLLNSFRLRMIAYYADICRARADQLDNLLGWIDRALA